MTGDAAQPEENHGTDAPGAWPPAGADGAPSEPASAAAPARPRSPRRRSVMNPAEAQGGSAGPDRPRPAPHSRSAPPGVTQPAETTPSVPPRTVLPAAYGGSAADARDAGTSDTAEALRSPAARVEAEREERITDFEHAAAAETVAHAETGPGAGPARHASPAEVEPALPDPAPRADGTPDVMVLPEPNRNRPTVAIEPERPRPAPLQPTESALDTARRRVENSPFWLSEDERAAAAADHPGPDPSTGRGRPPRRRPVEPRRPVPGLAGLIVLALAAAFFSWVSAEPFWLAVGHGDPGTATVSRCVGEGVTQRCTGSFAAADGRYTVNRVVVLGVEGDATRPGATAPARMVAADSRQAYAGTGPLVHLRWVLGFALVLLCGYGIAGVTGARRLPNARARQHAVLVSLAGPTLLLAGFLAAAY